MIRQEGLGDEGAGAPAPGDDGGLLHWLAAEVARRAGMPPGRIVDPERPIASFALDSLATIELMHAIELRTGVTLEVETLFSDLSLAGLAAAVRERQAEPRAGGGPAEPESPPPETAAGAEAADGGTAGDFPLSRSQLSLWFLHALAPESPAYNVPNALRIRGALDTAALLAALQELVDRHPALRTTFVTVAGEPRQRVAAAAALEAVIHDAAGWGEERLAAHLAAESARPFDLERGPLVRAALYTRAAGADNAAGAAGAAGSGNAGSGHVLLLAMHHIVTDFWSLGVLLEELAVLYRQCAEGRPTPPPEAAPAYADFALRQERELAGPAGEALWDYWRGRLAGELPVLDLPADRPRPRVQGTAGSAHRLVLAAELTGEVRRQALAGATTPFVVLAAAFAALLHRYTGLADVVLGTVGAARTRAEFARCIGYFVNPLVLRTDLGGDPGFGTLLARARREALGAFAHQDYPFPLLVERLQPERDPGRTPIFQAMFVFQKARLADGQDLTGFALGEAGARVDLGSLVLEAVPLPQRIAQFDLTLTMGEVGGRLVASFDYNVDLFDAATIERLAGHFARLLAGALAAPGRPVSALPLVGDAERRQLIETWNDTRRPWQDEATATLAGLFARQAAATPLAPAAIFAGRELTYGGLDRRARGLARRLVRLGIGPEARVGICVERSFDVLAAPLAVLLAGGAYLPLDPEYPRERLAHLLAQGGVSLVVAHRRLLPLVERSGGPPVLCLDEPGGDGGEDDGGELDAGGPVVPANLACVIFTSGSTGLPKGVLLTHANLVSLVDSFAHSYRPAAGDRILPLTSIAYASFVGEVFPLLSTGGAVVLPQKHELLDPAALAALVARERVTMISTVPSMLANLDVPGGRLPHLRLLLLGGEALTAADAAGLGERTGGLRIVNGYGLTETAICSTIHDVVPAELAAGRQPPIGRPLPNQRVYVLDRLDRLGEPRPIGCPGELYVAGAGIARGYAGSPELTAARFVPDPFADGGRLYRTGDLAAVHAGGDLAYLGRADQQVKLRGFRIELAEIEAALALHPGVGAAAVVVRRDDGEARLVAYVVAAPELAADAVPAAGPAADGTRAQAGGAELLAGLRDRLPDYMVPAALVFLDALPRTPNGKLDAARLPAPPRTRPDLAAAYAAPRSELERTIAAVWREALKLEGVGLDDSFFDLGGHSLLMTRVHARLREVLGREVPLIELFQYPTVRSLARHLAGVGTGAGAGAGGAAEAPAAPGTRAGGGVRAVLPASGGRSRRGRATAPGAAAAPGNAGNVAAATAGTAITAATAAAAEGETGMDRDIAVIGLAGRFPGAASVGELWLNLAAGREGIRFFSADELLAAGVDPALVARPDYVRAKGILGNVDLFDAAFFGLNPREAELMDPQHRVFLECAWEALEDAGWDAEGYPGLVGVYAGLSMNTYLLTNLLSHMELVASADTLQASLGNDKDPLTARVSYKLNLRGPSVTIQSASSTSLVAVHEACQALQGGACDMALAGGVSIHLPEVTGYLYQEGGTVSRDGHCRAFDAASTGFVSGHGCGVVVLKPLSAALADRDHVYAVIKGAACNNDGAHKVSFMAPSVGGQIELYRLAYENAGIDPASISYVECHGTATAIGDPIEITALSQAFAAHTSRRGFCAIGSIKTNIGHLDTAAGVCGLIKAVLALHHRQIPPSLHFQAPNPRLNLAESPFFVNTRLRPWETGEGVPRRAGVTSLGMGGTNAHVVLEEAPRREAGPAAAPARPWQLLTLSAKSATALDRATLRLAEHLRLEAARRAEAASAAGTPQTAAGEGPPAAAPAAEAAAGREDGSPPAAAHPAAANLTDANQTEALLADIAYTLQVGRKAFQHRRALLCRGLEEAAQALDSLDPERVLSLAAAPGEHPVAFLFPGQGAQYPGMGRGLYAAEPAFRAAVDRCCALLPFDLRAELWGAEAAAERLEQTAVAQPALFVLSWATAQLWLSWGVRPSALLGHSIGEYVAACLAGVFSLEDALALVVERGRLMQQMAPGAMLAVPLPEAEVMELLAALDAAGRQGYGAASVDSAGSSGGVGGTSGGDGVGGGGGGIGELSLAAVNRPNLSVVSGSPAAIRALAAELEARGVTARRLHTSHAFHSFTANPLLAPFTAAVRRVRLAPPGMPLVSNLTGTWMRPEEATDPAYWARQLRGTVRFADGLACLLAEPQRILVEAGPGDTLTGFAREHPARGPEHAVVASLRHPKSQDDDQSVLLRAAARLWLAGGEIDWRAFSAGEERRRVPLPTYPFERRRYWVEPLPAKGRAGAAPRDPRQWTTAAVWRPAPAGGESGGDGLWLLLTDRGSALGEQIAARLSAEGRRWARILAGDRFAFLDAAEGATFTAAPGDAADMAALLAALPEAPRRIVHLWSLSGGSSTADPGAGGSDATTGFGHDAPGTAGVRDAGGGSGRSVPSAPTDMAARQAALDRGFYGPLFLAQALGRRGLARPASLLVVTGGLHDVPGDGGPAPRLAPGKDPAGLADLLPQELPNITCRYLDLPPLAAPGEAAAAAREILAEALRAGTQPRQVALRNGRRFACHLETVEISEAEAIDETGADAGRSADSAVTGGDRPAAPAAGDPATAPAGHQRPALATPFVAPEEELDRQIAAVLQEVLGVDRVGLHDNFFELGGNSLAGVRIISRLKERLQVDVAEVNFYEAPTVAAMSRLIGAKRQDGPAAAPGFAASRSRGERRKARRLQRVGGGETGDEAGSP